MPLHRGAAKALMLQRLPSRAIANATAGVCKAVQPDGRRCGAAHREPSLRIDTVEFRRGDQDVHRGTRRLAMCGGKRATYCALSSLMTKHLKATAQGGPVITLEETV